MGHTVIISLDPLIAQQEADQLLSKCEVTREYAGDLDIDRIFDQLGSADLFAEEKAFHYINIIDLKLGKKHLVRLEEILSNIPAGTTLVCTQVLTDERQSEQEKKLKSGLFQCWAKTAAVKDVRGLCQGAKAVQWLVERAKSQYGLKLGNGQVNRILLATGSMIVTADSEIRKLSLLKSDDRIEEIPDHIIDQIISQSPSAQFYSVIDSIMSCRNDAIAQLNTWFSLEPDTYRLLAELRRRFLGLRALVNGENVMPFYFAKQLRSVAGRWNGKLSHAISKLCEAEYRLKSGEAVGESSKAAEWSVLQLLTLELTDKA